MRQLARAKLLDTTFQFFQSPRQTAHHRIGASGNTEKQQCQKDQQPLAVLRLSQHLPRRIITPGPAGPHASWTAFAATLGQDLPEPRRLPGDPDHCQAASISHLHLEAAHAGFGLALFVSFRGRDALAIGVVQGDRHAQPLTPILQGGSLLSSRCAGRRQGAINQLHHRIQAFRGQGFGIASLLLDMALEQPGRTKAEHQQQQDQGQIDAEIE